jgi:hypothetical protein
MGTRSLTKVIEDGKAIVCMYRQFDGYPQGHGRELAEFLAPITMVNGLSGQPVKVANGYGCLAAQIVTHFKAQHDAGGIYLYEPEASDCGEEYVYLVEGGHSGQGWDRKPTQPTISVQAVYEKKQLFKGSPAEFLNWLEKVNEKEAET